jgi:F0F1-type ATP synthase assembly protein I
MLAVRIMADFGASIAVPVVLFAALGKRLDARFGTQPWLLVIGFVLAAAVSAILIWQKAKRYGREYESIEPAPTSQPKK